MENQIEQSGKASRRGWLLFVPCVTVFISSFCIMVLELVAGRLIARYLGSSLYTWTSVIGVVLTGITVGNYFGGRQWPPRFFGVPSMFGNLEVKVLYGPDSGNH